MSESGTRTLELERARLEQLRLEQVGRECEQLARTCERALASVRDVAAQQLARASLAEAARELERLRGAIATSPDAALPDLGRLAGTVQQITTAASERAVAWSAAQKDAVVAAQSARAEAESVGATHGDVAAAPAAEAIRIAEQGLAAARADRLDEARDLSARTRALCDEARAAALRERARREVVKGLLASLRELGFVTEGPSVEGGAVVLEGRMANGRRARFEVSVTGELGYDLDGYEGRACKDHLDAVERILQERFLVRGGPSQVRWSNPDKISKGARDNPAGGRKSGA